MDAKTAVTMLKAYTDKKYPELHFVEWRVLDLPSLPPNEWVVEYRRTGDDFDKSAGYSVPKTVTAKQLRGLVDRQVQEVILPEVKHGA